MENTVLILITPYFQITASSNIIFWGNRHNINALGKVMCTLGQTYVDRIMDVIAQQYVPILGEVYITWLNKGGSHKILLETGWSCLVISLNWSIHVSTNYINIPSCFALDKIISSVNIKTRLLSNYWSNGNTLQPCFAL